MARGQPGSFAGAAVLGLRARVRPAEASRALVLAHRALVLAHSPCCSSPAGLTFWWEAPWDSWDSFLGPRMGGETSLAK